MKKTIAILLCFIILLSTVCGCGIVGGKKATEADTKANREAEEVTQAAVQTTEKTAPSETA